MLHLQMYRFFVWIYRALSQRFRPLLRMNMAVLRIYWAHVRIRNALLQSYCCYNFSCMYSLLFFGCIGRFPGYIGLLRICRTLSRINRAHCRMYSFFEDVQVSLVDIWGSFVDMQGSFMDVQGSFADTQGFSANMYGFRFC